jgi:integrating conjugative element protein (TIGR03752 family)
MHSNALLKWLMVPLAIALVLVSVKFLTAGKTDSRDPGGEAIHLTPDEMKTLGIEGDTPRDTVATLVAQVKQLRNELQGAARDNQNQKTENERLRARESGIEQRVQSALDEEKTRLNKEREDAAAQRLEAQGLLQNLQARLDNLSKGRAEADLPVGFGLEEGDGQAFQDTPIQWIEPTGKAVKTGAAAGVPTGTALAGTPLAGQKPLDADLTRLADPPAETAQKIKQPVQPVYTVPANATLTGSVAMTALVGRVPIDGTVNDPYPFKILIGADNLTANGIELPEAAGAVVSGVATGDWTLSCVRGKVRSITFVFSDGTVRTVPDAGSNASNSNNNDGLGWIGDQYGIPCVSGEQRSNAAQYLGNHTLLTAAGAGAASLIKSDTGRVALVTNSDVLGTVGIGGQEAAGRILANGIQDMSEWVNKLYGQAFAAVYVRPGARVAVHIDRALEIDYDPAGRRVKHRRGEHHVLELD